MRTNRSLEAALGAAKVVMASLALASVAAADGSPLGQPYRSLDQRVAALERQVPELQSAVPILSDGIQAVVGFTSPGEIVVPANAPCPEGYHLSGPYGAFGKCVLDDPGPAPEPPPADCEAGYVRRETFHDGSPVPASSLVCERTLATSATVYVTRRSADFAPRQPVSLAAECPPSFVATGGGWAATDAATGAVATDLLVFASRPAAPDQWSVAGKFSGTERHDLTVFVVCAAEPVS
jgi:hypothetical protein